jgi:hypothetical protein
MQTYDFCFAWCWPYDVNFACRLLAACETRQISLLQVTPSNIEEILQALKDGQLCFRAYFDRASDVDEKFTPLAEWALRQDILYINRFWLAQRSWDKATMHHLFTRNGLDAPYTVILPSFQDSPDLPVLDLSLLGESYAIKPAHGGGGQGVILGEFTWEEMLQARQQHPQDQYLLQARVVPALLNNRPAWFRLIFCLGKIYAFWWDPTTHIYISITEDEQNSFGLFTLSEIVMRIASLSRLEIFSTEIAFNSSNRFLIVDYINDPIDLRSQSEIPQGMPEYAVRSIAEDLAAYAATGQSKGALYA